MSIVYAPHLAPLEQQPRRSGQEQRSRTQLPKSVSVLERRIVNRTRSAQDVLVQFGLRRQSLRTAPVCEGRHGPWNEQVLAEREMRPGIPLLLLLWAGPLPGHALFFGGHKDVGLPADYYASEVLGAPSACACKTRCLVHPPCTAFTVHLPASGEVNCLFSLANVTTSVMKPNASSWTFCKRGGCAAPHSAHATSAYNEEPEATTNDVKDPESSTWTNDFSESKASTTDDSKSTTTPAAASTTTTTAASTTTSAAASTTTSAAASTTTSAATSTTTGPRCTGSFVDLGAIGCYFFYESNINFIRAQLYCRGLRADLATPSSLDPLRQYLLENNYTGEYWVGLQRPNGWIDGRPDDPSEWDVGEPNGSGPCALLTDTGGFKAADANCLNNHKAICEQEV
ncbi:uncharacterized protein LOC125039022 [Penaeus chinensis]|uniref:uncharacterized protein LOC125039022 n=1 Tax=Penaeus chinensis TaxID=139456 RepID=UPI001FB5EDA5|nr:uncharacterized protein LOC125039022 [Penaeus chinensis]